MDQDTPNNEYSRACNLGFPQAYSSFCQKLAQPLGTSSKEFPQSTDPRQAERDSKKPIKYAEETPSVCLWGNISVTDCRDHSSSKDHSIRPIPVVKSIVPRDGNPLSSSI